ncbi:MAG: ABC transporter permease [Planctomycetes bacterium]|nr:ABC transporter permease [Planctomycetota bacterium]
MRLLWCLRAEMTKLWRQRLPWVGLGLAVGVAVLAAWMNAEVVPELRGAAAVPRNAFRFFAIGLRYGIAMGGFFLVLVAGLMVAAETGQGTLKMVLVRPVKRTEVFLAKVLTVFQYALVLLLAVSLSAALVAGACPGSDFGAVIDPEYADPLHPYIYSDAAEMWGHLLRAVALLVLPLAAAAVVGLTVSVLVENPGVASGTAVVAFLGLEIVKVFLERRPALQYLFNNYLPSIVDNSYVRVLQGASEGLTDAFWPAGLWWWNVWVPLGTAGALLIGSLLLFERKAILT